MQHQLLFDHETATDVVFRCAACGEEIGFNLPGIGEPAAVKADGGWAPPDNPDLWMTPCPEPTVDPTEAKLLLEECRELLAEAPELQNRIDIATGKKP